MTSGLVNASFSLPEWQAVKLIFFAPWYVSYPLQDICYVQYFNLSWKFFINQKVAFGTKKDMYIRKEFIFHENTNMAAYYFRRRNMADKTWRDVKKVFTSATNPLCTNKEFFLVVLGVLWYV